MNLLRGLVLRLVAFLILPSLALGAEPDSKISFWRTQKKGANFFNQVEYDERFAAAQKMGLDFIRLEPNDWFKAREKQFFGKRGHVLVGSLDQEFKKIDQQDVIELRSVIDRAKNYNLKVVLTILAQPGTAVDRLTPDKNPDLRLWQDSKFQDQAAKFWKQLAFNLRDKTNLVGYDFINEPRPNLVPGGPSPLADRKRFKDWSNDVTGTPADLNSYYSKVVAAIRQVDMDTPVILESCGWGSPQAMAALKPINDPYVLYSFHMYQPFAYNNPKNSSGKFVYPGRLPNDVKNPGKGTTNWDKPKLKEVLDNVSKWQKEKNIQSWQILVGEFGVPRYARGAEQYIKDLVSIMDANQWHWAFYSFREDKGDMFDYEVPPGPTTDVWTKAKKAGVMQPDIAYPGTPISNFLTSEFSGENTIASKKQMNKVR